MKLPTDFRLFAVCLVMVMPSIRCKGQSATTSHPLEHAAIIEGESSVNGKIKSQTESMQKTAALQGTINVAATVMKKWEHQYNSYLKTTQGYASSIKAATTVYTQGMQTLSALWELYTATRINTQGIFASMSMNNIYIEVATEFLRTYKLLNNVVAKGERENMLNGAERTQILWQLAANLERLNAKLRRLALSISVYSFEDVWNRAVAGKIEKSNGMLAEEARDRMQRAIKQVAKFYRYRQGNNSQN